MSQRREWTRLRAFLASLTIAVVAAWPCLSLAQTVSRQGRIVYGGDWAAPPFEFLDERGQPAGLNVDLVRRIAEISGFDVSVQLGPWPEIIAALEHGEIQMASLYYAPEREARFDFAVPHTITNYEFVVRTDDAPVRSLDDVHGRSLLVQEGTWIADYLEERAPDLSVTLVESEQVALERLAGGDGDVALVTREIGRRVIRSLALENVVASSPPVFPREYGFAVRQGDTVLVAALNVGMTTLKESGAYEELYDQWFGPAAPSAGDVWRRVRPWLIAAAAVAALLLAWIWTLRKTVALRTHELAAEIRERSMMAAVIEQAAVSVVITDEQGRIEYVNAAFEAMSGYSREEVIGQNPRILRSGLHDEPFYQDLWRRLSAGEPFSSHFVNRRKDGELYHQLSTIFPVQGPADGKVKYVSTGRDITREVALETQLTQAQKIEAIGRLAGGIAHDFNNLLTVIMGESELALAVEDGAKPLRGALEEIRRTAQRAAQLTRQLLAFSRHAPAEPTILSPDELLSGMERMTRRLIGENIHLIIRPGLAGARVKVDSGQLDQVLMNLVVNAQDAMPRGGTLEITTERVSIGEAEVERHPGTRPGQFARIRVRDTGIGIPEEIRARIFDPFFTTKPRGEGTGLGLAVSYGVVRQAGGFIEVESRPGTETTMSIYLPVAAEESLPLETAIQPDVPPVRNGTVLLVEDDASVRQTTSRILRRLGYEVAIAETGEDALRMLALDGLEADLLFSDIVLPGMSGPELARQARALRPGMKVLFASGYSEDEVLRQDPLLLDLKIVQKPFTIDELTRDVGQVLAAM